ncbi:MAG: transcriptional repressor, partial [Pseudomonadota bacterium]
NAYVACAHTSSRHTPVFLICVGCNAVAETDTPEPVVSKAAAEMGFEVKRLVVEAEGLCPACQEGAA